MTDYLCPGCLYLQKDLPLITSSTLHGLHLFSCSECAQQLAHTNDPKLITFYKFFSNHDQRGFRCPDCSRFIPHPSSNKIICPYLDCSFTGELSQLKRMNHPTTTSDLTAFLNNTPTLTRALTHIQTHSYKNSSQITAFKELIEHHIIDLSFSSKHNTINAFHKQYIYQAISQLSDQYGQNFVDYLSGASSNHQGFQHLIFQQYVRLIEKDLPRTLIKKRSVITLSSLLVPELNIFSKLITFENYVDEKYQIKNNTKELYIGGRKASLAKPYFIGKLLNLQERNTQHNVMDQVQSYTFHYIQLQPNVKPGTFITTTHLAIPPHYQLGSMLHINKVISTLRYELQQANF